MRPKLVLLIACLALLLGAVWLWTERSRRIAAEQAVAAQNAANAALQARSEQLARELAQSKQLPPPVPAPAATLSEGVPSAETGSDGVIERVGQLKRMLVLHPELGLPIFDLLTDDDWMNFAKEMKWDNEVTERYALAQLRMWAYQSAAPELRAAQKAWLRDHPGQTPLDPSQLKSYMANAAHASMLDRFTLWYGAPIEGQPANWYLRQTQPADPWFDEQLLFGANNDSVTLKTFGGLLYDNFHVAREAFVKENQRPPSDPAELRPYLKQPIDDQTLSTFLTSKFQGWYGPQPP